MNSQRQKIKQLQKLTPQQLLLMRLLQMPVTTLEQRIKEEVERNPMLELEKKDPDSYSSTEDSGETAEAYDSEEMSDFKDTDSDDFYEDDDYNYRERLERDRNVEEHRIDPSEGTSFAESLLRQIRLRNLSAEQQTICEEIIGSIDGSGYLGRDLQLIANDLAFRSGIDVSDKTMEEMLAEIQSCEPAGVGARSLQECLSLQLHRKNNDDTYTKLAKEIVDNHFNQLSNKHYSSLMTSLKINEATLNGALKEIRRLNPKPGWGREEENRGAAYIVPDFVVRREGGILSMTLNSRNLPQLHISDAYSEMQKELSELNNLSGEQKKTLQFINDKGNEAQWLLDTLAQRERTMTATMSAILKWQTRYFISGDSVDLKPMRLRDIALETGYDESTISRVVNQKYVQCDFGTILLKDLFAKAVKNDQGDVMATNAVKEALQNIVDNEDKRNPLTDDSLAQQMEEKGYKLSRRTVAKYRELLGIPVARLRKELK